MKTNPILDEIRTVRDNDARLMKNDIHRLFSALRSESENFRKQGRSFWDHPANIKTTTASVREESQG
jgi:hypothetical protein